MSKKNLWLRLKDYHFADLVPPHLTDQVASMFGGGDASTHAFASKLARKLGWSAPFARRAIDEYKKFVYLGTMGDMSVTPSKVIDQVWHEHLLFTRGYREFCKKVLHRDFDHHPELVPASAQSAVFEDQYLATLDAYRAEFNAEPPADIWRVPKFKPGGEAARSRKRKRDGGDASSGDAPLYTYFDSGGGSGEHSHDHPEFGGGGGFAGAGAERSWGSDDAQSDASGHGHGDGDDGGGSDSSDSGGGDSGGGDSGGSSCSSSCGGGGCGGGGD